MYKFSSKQRLCNKLVATGKHWNKDAVICDGAIRSGKTLSMSLGFVMWASAKFNGMAFAMCGKTINLPRRNVVTPLLECSAASGFIARKSSAGTISISPCTTIQTAFTSSAARTKAPPLLYRV